MVGVPLLFTMDGKQRAGDLYRKQIDLKPHGNVSPLTIPVDFHRRDMRKETGLLPVEKTGA